MGENDGYVVDGTVVAEIEVLDLGRVGLRTELETHKTLLVVMEHRVSVEKNDTSSTRSLGGRGSARGERRSRR